MSKASRGKRWGHPETVSLLEIVIENAKEFAAAKGRLESRRNFFDKEAFKIIQDGGRDSGQMNVRLENLFKEYRRVSDVFGYYSSL